MSRKRVSQSERLFACDFKTDSEADRFQCKRGIGTMQYFMCTAQSFDSSALGIVDVQVRECSSVVQEYSSVQALLFLDSNTYDYDIVHGVIVEAGEAVGYRHPTRKQLQMTEQFVW